MKDYPKDDAAPMETGPMDTEPNGVGRRGFLTLTAAGLFMPMVFGVTNRAAQAASSAPVMLGAYIRIGTDNTVTAVIGSTEMGQGIMTGMAQLVAEELQVNWSQMRAEHAPASALWPNPYGNPIFGAQITGGSTSMMGWYLPMRTAAAIVRDTLLAAANKKYGGTWTLGTAGTVVNGATTHKFSELLDVAATITPPTTAKLATTTTYIGKTKTRLDIPSKVNGTAVFGMDVKVDGMMFATVVHPPVVGSTVKKMPTSVAHATLVNLTTSVGVVATDTWTAMNAANSIAGSITWTLPADTNAVDSAALLATAQTLLTSTTVPVEIAETLGTPNPSAGTKKIDATYALPFLIHAAMEVMNCTASVTTAGTEIWAPTQGQQFIAPAVQAVTGHTADQVTVHSTWMGGGFGRKIESDYVTQAVQLSKAMGKPVKLIWTRESDFKADMYRPMALIRVRASTNSNGKISQFTYRNVSASINLQRGYTDPSNPEDTGALAGAVGLPYYIPNKQIEFVALQPCNIPLGYWRSVGESYNTFAVESAMDELALATALDPMAFRKTALSGSTGNPRMLAVLKAVETLSNWATPPASGHARGVAMLSGFGSFIAVVADVSKSTAGEIKVNNFYAAIDCGVVVNPGQVTYQMQGGILHGLSAAMWHGQTFKAGKAAITNFNKYPIIKMNAAPAISVKLVTSTEAPGGVGETGVPCVAPAIANAWAKLTGARLRALPFYPGRTMGDG